MVDEGKSAADLINAVIGMLFIFLVFMIIILAVSMDQNWFGVKRSTKPPNLLPADYFDVIEPWGETTFIKGKVPDGDDLLGVDGSSLDLSVCTWFTYQNLLDINKLPSLQNAIADFENGFSHLSPPQSCIDSDQIVFKRAKRDCTGKGIAECIGLDGLLFDRNKVEIFNYPCTGDIPLCTGSVGALSFNFLETSRGKFNLVDAKTRVMTIETIFVSPARLAELDSKPVNQFYTRQGQLFTTSDVYTDLTDDQYYPIITYQGKQKNSFKQSISFRRYNYSGGYVENETGPYAELVYRPGNLYLDVEINNNPNQIDGFTVNSVKDMTVDLYRNQYKIRKMYKTGDPIQEIDTTCTGYIIGENAYISIYRRGKDKVNIGDTLLILADDNSTKSLSIVVTKVFDFSIFFVFKPIKTGFTPRKWLLIPPMNIGGGKVIPRRDRSSYMRVFNAPPFDEALYNLAKTRPGQGTKRSTEGNLKLAYNGRNPLNEFHDGLYTYTLFGSNAVNKGTKALIRTLADNKPQTDNDILPERGTGQYIAWWEILETLKEATLGGRLKTTSKKLVAPLKYEGNSDTFNGGVYPNDTTEQYILSIGDKAGHVDPTTSAFYTIQPFLGWKNQGARQKAMLSMLVTGESPNLIPGNRFVDGSVIWELVNPQNEITVYSPSYFSDSSVVGKGITDFIPTEESTTQKYKQEQKGVLFQIVFFGYELVSDSQSSIDFINNFTGSFSDLSIVGEGSGGQATVHFLEGRLIGITIQQQGSGYKIGGDVTITIPEVLDVPVTITNLLSDAENIKYSYVAIPQDQESNNYFVLTESDTKKITKNGFSLKKRSVEINDNGQLSLTGNPKEVIENKGSGYTIDSDRNKNIVYIDQIDQFGNSSITDRSPSSFYSFIITELDADVINVKTKSLFSPSVQTSLPDFVVYNFYDGEEHGRVYGNSPQQIGFIDDVDITNYITTGGDDQIKEYLFRNAEQPFNSIVGINTLQFESLDYTESENAPTIKARENLVLGKFIPYTDFYSENSDYPDTTLRNYNYVQYIPNSISNIYSREIDENALPIF